MKKKRTELSDCSDFVFDIIYIKRSDKTDAEKHAEIMHKIIEKPEHLHYAAAVLDACIMDDGSLKSEKEIH